MAFLVVAVDYLPIAVCWVPLIVVGFFASRCEAFVESVSNLYNRTFPE